jgi:hypothetical protein
MNILWIEDFGGLPAGKNILNQMFGELLGFDAWNNDLLSLKEKPSYLNEFCTQQESLHTFYLCRNYFDYAEFKENHAILNEIDAIIIDVRLDNGEHVDLEKDIPAPYTDKSKFHENGGFYIFNDLIHLGIPTERMCFMTAETSTVKSFEDTCIEIYMPKVTAYEKTDVGYKALRKWLAEQELPYRQLRRGIIEACQYLKKLNEPPTSLNQFQDSGKETNLDEIHDYLQVLENFLPLRKPDDKATCYKLFLRTLTHEWESAKPDKIKGLAWIMKCTRNWITHNSNLFNALDEKMLTYLFIINMRVMFDFDKKFESYEKILLNLFATDALTEQLFKDKSKNKLIPIGEAYCDIKNLALDNNVKDAFVFSTIANNIQESGSSIRNDKQLFSKLLYQMFWLINSYPRVDTKNRKLLEINFYNFDYVEKTYLFELARHIYNRSFP